MTPPREDRRRPGRLVLTLAACAACLLGALGLPGGEAAHPADVVLVVDLSRSHGSDPRALVAAALAHPSTRSVAEDDTRWALVGYATRALVLHSGASDLDALGAAAQRRLAGLDARFADGSDAAAGLASAMTQGRPDRPLRLVVFSDGRLRFRDLDGVRRRLAARGGALELVGPLGPPAPDVRLEPFGASAILRPGRPGLIRVRVVATDRAGRGVELQVNGRTWRLADVGPAGQLVELRVVPPADADRVVVEIADPGGPNATPLNDRLAFPVRRDGERRIGIVGPGAQGLSAILAANGRRVAVLPDRLRAEDLRGLDVVALADCPVGRLGAQAIAHLEAAVRDAGTGLVVCGGPHAFRAGGYAGSSLDDLLPLSSRAARGRDVLVLLDHSGSMERDRRLVTALEAIAHLARALGREDRVQVFPFASRPSFQAPLPLLAPKEFLADRLPELVRLAPRGGTRVVRVLDAVLGQLPVEGPSDRERVWVLVSDCEDDALRDASETARMRRELTARRLGGVVLLLDPSAEDRAKALGVRVIPVSLSKEVILRAVDGRGWKVEETATRVRERLPGLSEAGPLRGRNPVLPGQDARVVLETADGAPVLALARRGRGEVAALATDPTLEGWTRSLVRTLAARVFPRAAGRWELWFTGDRLEVRVGATAGPEVLRARAGDRVWEFRERAAGVWSADLGLDAPAWLSFEDGEGRVLAREPVPPRGDAEFRITPRSPGAAGELRAPAAAAGPRVRWPWAALALLLLTARVLVLPRRSRAAESRSRT